MSPQFSPKLVLSLHPQPLRSSYLAKLSQLSPACPSPSLRRTLVFHRSLSSHRHHNSLLFNPHSILSFLTFLPRSSHISHHQPRPPYHPKLNSISNKTGFDCSIEPGTSVSLSIVQHPGLPCPTLFSDSLVHYSLLAARPHGHAISITSSTSFVLSPVAETPSYHQSQVSQLIRTQTTPLFWAILVFSIFLRPILVPGLTLFPTQPNSTL